MKIERNTYVYNLPFSKDHEIHSIQSTILRFPSGSTVDIGSLCYLDRDESAIFSNSSKRRRKHSGRRVNVESIDKQRTEAVGNLIKYISNAMSFGGSRPETIRDRLSRLIPFMDWADKNNYQKALADSNVSKECFREYVKFLREKVNSNTISVNGAARQQFTVLRVLEDFFDDDSFSNGINLIRSNVSSKTTTSPPEEEAQAKVLSLCEHLFDSIYTFITEFKPYPFPLTVPAFAKYQDNKLWIFPTTSWFKHPDLANERSATYNYTEGRLSTMSEISETLENSKIYPSIIKIKIEKSKKQIEASNEDIYNVHRLHQAMNSLQFFIILFLSETGINWSQLINLTWSDDYEVEASRQLFRVIKWRANNKPVCFEVSSSFIPKFNKFLSIRKYLLQDHECKWLFFSKGFKRTSEPTQMKETLNNTYDILRKIYPDVVPIKSRQWRSAKSDWLIRNTDPATTALILQNSEKTVLASYAAGSETSQTQEISKYLNEISNTVIKNREKVEGGKSHSLGICTDYGFPSQEKLNTTIKSDCKNPEGCLFCEKFKIHADGIDTRKLISCRYCINQTMHLIQGTTFHEDSIRPILTRISELLVEISKKNPNVVDKITEEVEVFGELDPYWGRKLEMLIELGITT